MLQGRGTTASGISIPIATALGLFICATTACKKGSPTGPDLAQDAGATINVLVTNSGVPEANVSVQAKDSTGETTSAQTGAAGTVSFPAGRPGTWTLTVPTQGNFYKSSATVSVSENQASYSLTFAAEGQILVVAPLTVETYGTLGGEVRYLVQYLQPGSLTLPVSLVIAPQGTPWPSYWASAFTPVRVGDSTDVSNLVISIPSGSTAEPLFTLEARRNDGVVAITSTALRVRRTFRIRTTFYVENKVTGGVNPNHFEGYLHFEPEIGSSGTQWILNMDVGLSNSAPATTFATDYSCYTSYLAGCASPGLIVRSWTLGTLPKTCMTGSTGCTNVSRGLQTYWVLPGDQIPVTVTYDNLSTRYPQFRLNWVSGVANLTQDSTIPYACQDVPVPGVFTLTQ